MKLYHYTTIDALAMIMSTRSIKFNRLDKVDDVEERAESQNVKLWQYIFVSCWTENAEESIPLWRMYSGNSHGVRIGFEADMFEDNIIGDSNIPPEIPHEGFFVCKIPPAGLFRKDYFVAPTLFYPKKDGEDTLFYCHVEYVNDVNEKTRDAYKLAMTDNVHASTNVNFGIIGKYKNKRWAFQEESRFRLLILPFNPIIIGPELAGSVLVDLFMKSVPVPITEYFLKLKTEVLNKIEITLHPNATQSDRVIVEALCNKYAKNAVINDSFLKDKVALK